MRFALPIPGAAPGAHRLHGDAARRARAWREQSVARRWLLAGAAILALLAPGASHAKEAVTWIESYEDALAEARQTGKPIFLEFRCAP